METCFGREIGEVRPDTHACKAAVLKSLTET